MRLANLALAALAGALVSAAADVSAMTCYIKYDRNDNVVYRDSLPPVDMSDRGAAARDAMRKRGECRVFMETDECPGVIFNLGAGLSGSISVDEKCIGLSQLRRPAGGQPPSTNAGASDRRAPRPAPAQR